MSTKIQELKNCMEAEVKSIEEYKKHIIKVSRFIYVFNILAAVVWVYLAPVTEPHQNLERLSLSIAIVGFIYSLEQARIACMQKKRGAQITQKVKEVLKGFDKNYFIEGQVVIISAKNIFDYFPREIIEQSTPAEIGTQMATRVRFKWFINTASLK